MDERKERKVPKSTDSLIPIISNSKLEQPYENFMLHAYQTKQNRYVSGIVMLNM